MSEEDEFVEVEYDHEATLRYQALDLAIKAASQVGYSDVVRTAGQFLKFLKGDSND